jgi:hypothetical protein
VAEKRSAEGPTPTAGGAGRGPQDLDRAHVLGDRRVGLGTRVESVHAFRCVAEHLPAHFDGSTYQNNSFHGSQPGCRAAL